MSRVKLAVVGNGMVGHRFIEDLLDKADKDQFEITVFCEEPRIAYDRVHLSSYFSHHTAEELSLVREGLRKTRREGAGRRRALSPSIATRRSSTPTPAAPSITTS